jgi:hypothetical protein
MILKYFIRWFNITRTNHTIIGIFWRDTSITKKDEFGAEEYTTVERILMAIFYCITILCFNLTINLVIYTINSSCEGSTRCYIYCTGSNVNGTCEINSSPVGPFNTPKPVLKMTKTTKLPNFALKLRTKQVFFYAYDSSYTSQQITQYSQCANSPNCITACVEKDLSNDPRPLCSTVDPSRIKDMICLSPYNTCKMDAKKPDKIDMDTKQWGRFLLIKVLVSACSSLLVNLLITPTRIALKFIFEGTCRPKHSRQKMRILYTLIAKAIFVLGVIVCLIWLGIAFYALYGYFEVIPSSSKTATITSTIIFFLISIFVIDLLITACLACVTKQIFCPPGDKSIDVSDYNT